MYFFVCRCAQLFGVSEEVFIRAADDVMLSLIDNIETFISWPNQYEYPQIANQFDQMGRFVLTVQLILNILCTFYVAIQQFREIT